MAQLQSNDRIFVAGHRGLVGSALVEALQAKGYRQLILRTHAELDLEDSQAVETFFRQEKPTVVLLAAAKVGGIHANNIYRFDFIHRNLRLQNNVIGCAHQYGVHRLIFLGSSCIYPKNVAQPMRENALLTGELEYTNRPYAIAKIAGMELVEALRRQHGCDYFSVMPTNLYGPNDNFHPENSHVIPALIRRFCEAKIIQQPSVTIWGSGKPRREFLYAADCAEAIVWLAEKLTPEGVSDTPAAAQGWSHINIGSSEEVTIADLAKLLAKVVDYRGTIHFDANRPDGPERKLMDSSWLKRLGWQPRTRLADGLKTTVEKFQTDMIKR